MSELEKYFPQSNNENQVNIVIIARKHWIAFAGQFTLSIIFLLIPLIIYLILLTTHRVNLSGVLLNFAVLGTSIYYLIAITFIFAGWVTFYYDLFILTEEEIVDVTQEGFWGRKIAQLSLLRVQDVSSHIKGFFPTMFGYGNVQIETAGEQSQTFYLECVPHPQIFAAKVLELHNQLIAKGGRHNQIADGEGRLTPIVEKEISLTPPPETENKVAENKNEISQDQGEVNKDDLNKGGEIKL